MWKIGVYIVLIINIVVYTILIITLLVIFFHKLSYNELYDKGKMMLIYTSKV